MENIRFYNTRFLSLIYEEYEFVSKKIDKIQETFSFFKTVSVYYYETLEEMQKKIPIKLPDWIKGLSTADEIHILNPSEWKGFVEKEDSLAKIFVHEYVHVAIFNSFHSQCPCWLNEGLAQIISEQFKKQKSRIALIPYDYYKKGYDDDEFYYQSALVTFLLIEEVGIDNLLKHCMKCYDFENDEVVGTGALQKKICLYLEKLE